MNALRCLFGCTLLVSIAASAAPQVDVVAKGLANPRGLAFAPDGALYVAEAGKGGDGACAVLSDGQTACYGETGAVVRIDVSGGKDPVRVLDGLPSLAAQGGFGAAGPQAVAFATTGEGKVALGLASQPETREGLGPKAHLLARVLSIPRVRGGQLPVSRDKAAASAPAAGVTGQAAQRAQKKPFDLAFYEAAEDPAGDGVDSNPVGLLALGREFLAVDAGGNSLLKVDPRHAISTLATFGPRDVPAPPFLGLPPGATIPMQAVPTSVARGPDGALYVGQLTGFPFPVGEANVYRVPADGGEPEVFASGFTNIISLAFDAAGRLYVLQIGNGFAGPGGPPLQSPGRLIRVEMAGTRTIVYENLFYPGGVAIGPDGAAYVTNNSIVPGPIPEAFPDGGQVLRISLD
ncbi:ScyD/ScyE family protein [Massilia sp. METH4]|uniref:ScyD/ScyE family protein n=1 Tax=Massilia sp. METH4 TaxID=3123041 RepID=UPI0030CEE715